MGDNGEGGNKSVSAPSVAAQQAKLVSNQAGTPLFCDNG